MKQKTNSCTHCGVNYDDNVNLIKMGDELICKYCLDADGYQKCEVCGKWSKNVFVSALEEPICEDCAKLYHLTCACCDGTFDNKRRLVRWSDILQDYICQDCYTSGGELNNRYYQPTPTFCDIYEPDDKLYFTVELVIDGGTDIGRCASYINALNKPLCLTKAKSPENGVRIITQPCTLNYHQTVMQWESICDVLECFGFLSENVPGCGMRIHVGRKALGNSNSEIEKTTKKTRMLLDKFQDELIIFYRRNKQALVNRLGLNSVQEKIPVENMLSDWLFSFEEDCFCDSFSGFALSFLLFNGTTTSSDVISAIQLCNNLCKYAMCHTPNEINLSRWEDILAINQFSILNLYCAKHNLLQTSVKELLLQPRNVPHAQYNTVTVGDEVSVIRGGGYISPDRGGRGYIAAVDGQSGVHYDCDECCDLVLVCFPNWGTGGDGRITYDFSSIGGSAEEEISIGGENHRHDCRLISLRDLARVDSTTGEIGIGFASNDFVTIKYATETVKVGRVVRIKEDGCIFVDWAGVTQCHVSEELKRVPVEPNAVILARERIVKEKQQ